MEHLNTDKAIQHEHTVDWYILSDDAGAKSVDSLRMRIEEAKQDVRVTRIDARALRKVEELVDITESIGCIGQAF